MASLVVLLAACTAEPEGDHFATSVETFVPTGSGGFGSEDLPGVVLGPPLGGGMSSGSTDVLSLGCGGSIVLGFGPTGIADRPGPDFIVFENPFVPSSGGAPFVEPGEVSVSADGEAWTTFTCIVEGEEALRGCAGVTPVLSHPDNGIDPSDPGSAGGDAFDLQDVGLSRARYVRIVDRTEEFYGTSMWCSPPKGGFDLDAISVVVP
jgi:hypothetical protein